MPDGMTTLISLLLGAIILFLFFIFIRTSRAFKGIFGVMPRQATQEMVNKKILVFQRTLAQYENAEASAPGSVGEDVAGYIESKLERAKKLAQKYGFRVPLPPE